MRKPRKSAAIDSTTLLLHHNTVVTPRNGNVEPESLYEQISLRMLRMLKVGIDVRNVF